MKKKKKTEQGVCRLSTQRVQNSPLSKKGTTSWIRTRERENEEQLEVWRVSSEDSWKNLLPKKRNSNVPEVKSKCQLKTEEQSAGGSPGAGRAVTWQPNNTVWRSHWLNCPRRIWKSQPFSANWNDAGRQSSYEAIKEKKKGGETEE